MTERSGPLAGLLVADFSRILAGPYATMLLADLGAEVVKVESPAGRRHPHLEPARCATASRPTTSASTATSARSPSTSRTTTTSPPPASWPAGPTCSSRTSSRAGWPASASTTTSVSAGNPGVVYASISGFGSGPGGRDLPGYDLMVQAISGLMSLTGDPDGPPYRAGISVFDVMAGLHATIGVLAALNARHETGRGQHVEVNLLSSALSGLVNQSSAFVAGGVVPTRMGNSHPSLFPYEPLPCSDGDLIVTAGNNGQFRRLVEVLGVPELADDPRFRGNEDRTAHRDELRPLLVERLATRTTMEWFEVITAAGVPVRPDQHHRRRGRVRRVGRARPGGAGRRGRRRGPVGAPPDPAVRRRRPTTGCPLPASTSTATRSGAGSPSPRPATARSVTHDDLPHVAGHLERRRDPAARPGPHRRPHGQGRLRRAGLLARRDAPPHPLGDPGLRGRARGAGRPRVHPDRHRGTAHLPLGARLPAGCAGRRPARWRVALPRRHRGLRGLPRRRGRRPGRRPARDRRAVGCRGARRRAPHQGGRSATSRAWATRCTRTATRAPRCSSASPRRRGCAARTCGCSRPSGRVHEQVLGRRLPLNGAGVCGAALADLGLPGRAAARVRPARPGGRAARPARGGAAPARSAWTSTSPSTATRSTSTRSPDPGRRP